MNTKIRKAVYNTYNDKYQVTSNVLEKGNYILINSIETDFDKYLNTDTDFREYTVYLEVRSHSTSIQTANNIENYIINNLSTLYNELKLYNVDLYTLKISSVVENNDIFENYYSKLIKINLIIKE